MFSGSAWLLFAGCFRQATGAALFGGWHEPAQNTTTKAGDLERRVPGEMNAMFVTTAFETIWLNGDPRRPRTAGFGMDFRVYERAGVWAPCPTTVARADMCNMVGYCVDTYLCSTGCGNPSATDVKSITCTERLRPFCSTAFLTQIPKASLVSHYACASDIDEMYYAGFTTETFETVFDNEKSSSAATATTSLPATTSSSSSTNPTSLITEAPDASGETAGQAEPSSGTSATESGINIGAIVGGAIGGLAVVCGSAVAAVWLFHRNRRANAAKHSSDSDTSDGMPWMKAELDATACSSERSEATPQTWPGQAEIMDQSPSERAEIMGQPRAELSAKGPAAYAAAEYNPASYPPMTPVELPTRYSWR
ncbi:hypothetical protein VTJ83DRAFT_3053 [Remersonia thermophila]|uniref:Uncharacterized protein n=1 Tax=Remersonia thermophila TaxID=72144 RepID=A0ABR4DCY1_9PEZI